MSKALLQSLIAQNLGMRASIRALVEVPVYDREQKRVAFDKMREVAVLDIERNLIYQDPGFAREELRVQALQIAEEMLTPHGRTPGL